jgi:hypothetical protein
MIFDRTSPEPNRALVLVDNDQDYWWYNSRDTNPGWQFSSGDDNIGKNYITQTRSWEDVREAYAQDGMRVLGKRDANTATGKVKPMGPEDEWYHRGTINQGFVVKDSGVREQYANGFVRDTEDGKYDYARVLRIEGLHLIPIEALERWGAHMVKGAEKYGEDNWRQARGLVAIGRFIRSLCRHTVQFIRKNRDEDHAAAVCFNVWAAELTPEED